MSNTPPPIPPEDSSEKPSDSPQQPPAIPQAGSEMLQQPSGFQQQQSSGYQQQAPRTPVSSDSGKTLILLSAIGVLLIAVIELVRIAYDLVNVLDIALYWGEGFLGEYFLHSNYQYFGLIFLVIGAIGLLSKKKWGWSIGLAATGFMVLLFIYYLIASAVYAGFGGLFNGSPRLVLLAVTSVLCLGVAIMLILPSGRKTLQVGGPEIGIGAAVLGFLIIDFVITAVLM